jgi:hypothetical protein
MFARIEAMHYTPCCMTGQLEGEHVEQIRKVGDIFLVAELIPGGHSCELRATGNSCFDSIQVAIKDLKIIVVGR